MFVKAPAEGAGAGEPVNFIGKEVSQKDLNFLTNGVKHGKLNAEEQQFLDRILSDPDMTPESNPKRKPPRAATATMYKRRLFICPDFITSGISHTQMTYQLSVATRGKRVKAY